MVLFCKSHLGEGQLRWRLGVLLREKAIVGERQLVVAWSAPSGPRLRDGANNWLAPCCWFPDTCQTRTVRECRLPNFRNIGNAYWAIDHRWNAAGIGPPVASPKNDQRNAAATPPR